MKKFYLAYAGLYLVSASDSIRYSMGWATWILLIIGLGLTAIIWFLRSKPLQTLKLVPPALWLLLGWMILSLLWSSYQSASLIGLLEVFFGTGFALFLVASFDWKQLLKLLANTMRFILVISIAFELFAATVIRAPIYPLFRDFQNLDSHAQAYYWTRSGLFKGERIQGIVGNANLLAYLAMLGLILFLVQYAIGQTHRAVSVCSISLAALCLLLARSAGVTLALSIVALAFIVLVLAEGKDQTSRHRFYRVAYTIAGIGLFFIAIYSQEFFLLIGKTPDMTGRTDLWLLVISLISQKPWLGWGWIGYWQPGVKPYDGLFVREGVTYYQAHDIFLDFWVQIGAIGLALLLVVIVLTFIKLWRLAVRHRDPLYSWPLMIFLSLLGHNILESRMIIEIGWVLFILLAVKINDANAVSQAEPKIGKREALKILLARLIGRGWEKTSY
ncbi:MAG: O-antigen ligase family protein [Micrococcales bacterium]